MMGNNARRRHAFDPSTRACPSTDGERDQKRITVKKLNHRVAAGTHLIRLPTEPQSSQRTA